VERSRLPSGRSAAATGVQQTDHETLLARLASLSDTAYEELLAVPAEHALERLGATSVSVSRWERDRGVLRCLVNVGELAPGDERFPADETYDLSEWDSVVDLAKGHGSAYQLDDANLSDQGRELLQRFGHRSAISVPLYIGDRLWGELWATKRSTPLHPDAVRFMTQVADEVSGMVALAERLQQMSHLAFQDPLTGLGNRRRLDDTLDALLAADGPGTTVLVCDVNDLKRVNDEYGHDAGDKVILAVADALSTAAASHPGAVAVRLGGDEFAVLLRGRARSGAIHIVNEAARALSSLTPAIGISCGVAVVRTGTSVRDALAVADAAQYAAKRRGALLLVADESPAAADRSGATRPGSALTGAVSLERQPPRRRFRDLQGRGGTDNPHDALAGTLLAICSDLPSAPTTAREAFPWLGDLLLAGLGLDHWSLSTVDLEGDRLLRVSSLGLREGRSVEEADRDLHVDAVYPIDGFPLTEQAVRECGWFTATADDSSCDPGERAVLAELGRRFVVALGWVDSGEGLLLEVYGNHGDPRAVGATAALGAAAVLGRPLTELRPPAESP
jgi:diguanylate cyclase (GGDEF)-like protein